MHSKAPRNLAENKDIIQLLKEAEEKQVIKDAVVKGIMLGFVIAVIVAAALTFATVLSASVIIRLATGFAFIVSIVVASVTYICNSLKLKWK